MPRIYKRIPIFTRMVYKIRAGDGCWEWLGAKLKGYGQIQSPTGTLYAYRAMYEEFRGPIPPGLVLDHLCRNPACVKPAHLEPVTQAENIRRGEAITAKRALQTHCLRGHPLSGDNLSMHKSPGRKPGRACIACRHLLRGVKNPRKAAA